MLKRVVWLLFCFLPILSWAQRAVDSIDRLIRKGGHDTTLLNHNINAAKLLFSNEPKRSRQYLEKALKLAEKLKDDLKLAEVYHVYGLTYYFESELDECLTYNLKSLEIRKRKKDKRGMCRSYGNIGLIYELKGDISSSLWYHNASLHIEEELNNKMGIAQSLGNIGNLYMHLSDFDRALECQFKTIKILQELNDPKELATALGNTSNIYQDLGDFEKATEYAHKSLKLSRPLNDWHGLALTVSNLAVLKRDIKEYDSARIYVNESLLLYEKVGNKEGQARALQIRADILRELDSLDRAESEYTKALNLFTQVGDPDGASTSYLGLALTSQSRGKHEKAITLAKLALKQVEGKGYLDAQVAAYDLLYNSYVKLGRLKEALNAQRNYFILNDSLSRNKGLLEIQKHELKQTYEQRTMRDSLQSLKQKVIDDARLAESESNLKQQRVVRTALIIGILVVAGFLVFVFNRLRVIRKQKKEIETEKKIRE
ncbi:MAG: tetratricopeptide repeat protein, partial [Flavobacteriales bacterium]